MGEVCLLRFSDIGTLNRYVCALFQLHVVYLWIFLISTLAATMECNLTLQWCRDLRCLFSAFMNLKMGQWKVTTDVMHIHVWVKFRTLWRQFKWNAIDINLHFCSSMYTFKCCTSEVDVPYNFNVIRPDISLFPMGTNSIFCIFNVVTSNSIHYGIPWYPNQSTLEKG